MAKKGFGNVIVLGTVFGGLLLIADKNEKDKNFYKYSGQSIVGKYIELEPDSHSYLNPSDAMIKIRAKQIYYNDEYIKNFETQTGERFKRMVITAWYEYGTEIKEIKLSDNDPLYEQNIIQNGGKLLAVETTVDLNTHTKEAYYNVDDIKVFKLITEVRKEKKIN